MSKMSQWNQIFPPFYRPYYQSPLVVDRAEGVYITGKDGRQYLDAYAGVATLPLGHSHPLLKKAVTEQLENFGHHSAIYLNEPLLNYAESLLAATDGLFSRVFFVNSGSEAADFAIMLSRLTTGDGPVCSQELGYHGGSLYTAFATGLATWQPEIAPPAGLFHVPSPHCFTCEKKSKCVARNIPCLTELENLLTENSKKTSRVTVMLEPVMGVGGVLIPPPRWRTRFNHLVKEHKAILICDEVQTGFGRLGTKLFGFQKHGYTPDILCLGKGIAGGYPLAAVLMTEDVANASTNLLHFSTFGGHPISIAAATETLKLVSDEKLLQEVEENGQWLIQELKKVFASDPRVIDVRGEGYFIGIEVNNATESVSFLEKAYQNGALIGIGGLAKEVIRLEPALIFSKKDCQKLVEILATC